MHLKLQNKQKIIIYNVKNYHSFHYNYKKFITY